VLLGNVSTFVYTLVYAGYEGREGGGLHFQWWRKSE